MKLINAFVLSALIFFSSNVNADAAKTGTKWALDSENSRVNFVSIKKGNIAESHVFNDISGHIANGNASFTIKPDSVDSRVPIRDQRMREFLFETGIYPTIVVSANVAKVLSSLKTGDSILTTIPVTLSMHGVTKEIEINTRISRLNVNTLVVASTQSVLIRAANFNMIDGITKLAGLVNNLPIAETVPVNFSLQLKRD